MLHSQQQGRFTITNEFNRGYDGLQMFDRYVTNLGLIIVHENVEDLQDLLATFTNLSKLYVYTKIKLSPEYWLLPHVKHLIYDGPYFNECHHLHKVSVICPDIETVELKQVIHGRFDEEEAKRLQFRDLGRLTLKYNDDVQHQVKNLRAIVKDTNIEF